MTYEHSVDFCPIPTWIFDLYLRFHSNFVYLSLPLLMGGSKCHYLFCTLIPYIDIFVMFGHGKFGLKIILLFICLMIKSFDFKCDSNVNT